MDGMHDRSAPARSRTYRSWTTSQRGATSRRSAPPPSAAGGERGQAASRGNFNRRRRRGEGRGGRRKSWGQQRHACRLGGRGRGVLGVSASSVGCRGNRGRRGMFNRRRRGGGEGDSGSRPCVHCDTDEASSPLKVPHEHRILIPQASVCILGFGFPRGGENKCVHWYRE